MKNAGHVLAAKADLVTYSVPPNATTYDAIALMAEKNIAAVLVIEDGRIVGIATERDYARKIVLKGRVSRDTPVSEIMSSPVLYVGPRQSIEECMALMTDQRLRHLPVIDDAGELMGVISIGDLVKEIIAEQSFTIQQLQHYIAGGVA